MVSQDQSKQSGSKRNGGEELGMVTPQEKSSKKMKFVSSAETEPSSTTTISDDSKSGRGMSTMPRVVKRKLQKLSQLLSTIKGGKELAKHILRCSPTLIWEAVDMAFVLGQGGKNSVLSSAAKKWKDFKSTLTRHYILPYINDRERLSQPPETYKFIEKAQWDAFVASRLSKEFQSVHSQHAEIREKLEYNHRLSRKGYAGLEDELEETMPGVEIDRSTLWKRARQDKHGNIPDPKVAEKAKLIDDLQKKVSEGKVSVSGSNDVLTMALGPEHPGRVRGVGAGISPKQYFNLPKPHRMSFDDRLKDSLRVLLQEETKKMEAKAREEALRMEARTKQLVEAEREHLLSQLSQFIPNFDPSLLKPKISPCQNQSPKNPMSDKASCSGGDVRSLHLEDDTAKNGEHHEEKTNEGNQDKQKSAEKQDEQKGEEKKEAEKTEEKKSEEKEEEKKNENEKDKKEDEEKHDVEVIEGVDYSNIEVPSSLKSLCSYVETKPKEQTINFTIDKEVFGEERNTFLLPEDITQLAGMEEIGATVVAVYMRVLYEKLKKANMCTMVGFIDPAVVSANAGTITSRSRIVAGRLQKTDGEQIFMMPYNPGDHLYFNGVDQSYKNWTFHGEPWEATTNASRNVEEDDGHSRYSFVSEEIDMDDNDFGDFGSDPYEFANVVGDGDQPKCTRCGISRWKEGKDSILKEGVPAKVVWYFPPIPRFKRMFQSHETAKSLTWHAARKSIDGQMSHPADSPSWKLLDDKWPEFGNDPRNLRLALSSDGFNPHSSLSSRYSCWPVILVTYNLPPWMCMKRKFMMLTLLISGPKQPGNDIDVYLEPLIDDLKSLWGGIRGVYDAHNGEYFTLRAALMWTINDFPAYGNLSGCVVKGYKACPICGDDTPSHRLKNGHKICYIGHRKWLPINHPYRRQRAAFNGKPEYGTPPEPLTGEEVLHMVEDCDNVCWKKKSIFFDLEYWKYLPVRHALDVMHIEKNVCDSIIGTLLEIPGKNKDGIAARLDLLNMGVKTDLQPEYGERRTRLPHGPWNLSRAEKREKPARYAITRLCFFFNAICAKTVDVSKLDKLEEDVVVTLCLLEKYFPPSFFDIMVHLVVHLVREVRLCGPVYFRWMYPFERYMKVLKGYVQNRTRPEGCIAERYIAEEAIEFCTEHLSDVSTVGVPSSQKMGVSKPLSCCTVSVVDQELLNQAHLYVLENTEEVLPYIEQHMIYIKTAYPKFRKRTKWLQDKHNSTFIQWLRFKVQSELEEDNHGVSENLRWLAAGPNIAVPLYRSYLIKGIKFNIKAQDDVRTTQNSGVYLLAHTMQVASAKDKNPILSNMGFYGVIQEIWDLDYQKFTIPVFRCDWIDSVSGLVVDELGFTLVDLSKIGHRNDQFVLASQVKQVFFVDDPMHRGWSVVLSMPNREYNDAIGDDVLGDVIIECEPFTRGMPNVDTFDELVGELGGQNIRDGCEDIWIE
ncbi:unnamed protein product [Prunus brigantina]